MSGRCALLDPKMQNCELQITAKWLIVLRQIQQQVSRLRMVVDRIVECRLASSVRASWWDDRLDNHVHKNIYGWCTLDACSGYKINQQLAHISTEAICQNLPQDSGIRSDSSHWNSNVVIDAQNFLLMSRQLRGGSLQSNKNGVVLWLQSHRRRSQLHRFHCVFHLMNSSLRRPYRHWKIMNCINILS